VSANVLVETSRREKEREGNWWLDRGGGCPHLKLDSLSCRLLLQE